MSPAPRRRAAGACLALLPALPAASAAVLASVLLAPPVARAQEVLAPELLVQESLATEAISEDAAVALVREQTDGKVVRVDRKLEGGSLVYRVRVLSPDGRLREYRVDAATGAVR